jgi:anti-sigma factor RsiW
VTFRTQHLPEDDLFESYLAEQGGEPIEPPTAEHLGDCTECAARYADLRRFMDGLRSAADADLAEAFPRERLHAQQQQIARRIELLAHPARVISFPGRPGHAVATARRRLPPKWLVATTAAGIVLGIAAGTLFRPAQPLVERKTAAVLVSGASPVEAPVVATSGPALASDMDFFAELELALERPHTRELVALDELTPHVREVGFESR